MSDTNVLVTALSEEHMDGRWWADVDNHLWTAHPQVPGVWLVIVQVPFMINAQPVAADEATEAYGPYRLVRHAGS